MKVGREQVPEVAHEPTSSESFLAVLRAVPHSKLVVIQKEAVSGSYRHSLMAG